MQAMRQLDPNLRKSPDVVPTASSSSVLPPAAAPTSSPPVIVHPVVRDDQEHVEICATNDDQLHARAKGRRSNVVEDSSFWGIGEVGDHPSLPRVNANSTMKETQERPLDGTYVARERDREVLSDAPADNPITSTPQPSPDCGKLVCIH